MFHPTSEVLNFNNHGKVHNKKKKLKEALFLKKTKHVLNIWSCVWTTFHSTWVLACVTVVCNIRGKHLIAQTEGGRRLSKWTEIACTPSAFCQDEWMGGLKICSFIDPSAMCQLYCFCKQKGAYLSWFSLLNTVMKLYGIDYNSINKTIKHENFQSGRVFFNYSQIFPLFPYLYCETGFNPWRIPIPTTLLYILQP